MYIMDDLGDNLLVESLVCWLAVKNEAENSLEWTVCTENWGDVFDVVITSFHLMLEDWLGYDKQSIYHSRIVMHFSSTEYGLQK